jgi:hypothetical protein
MSIIYYVGLRLSQQSQKDIHNQYGIAHKLHSTIVYSRTWFPYKPRLPAGLIVDPPLIVDYFGDIAVLRFTSDILTARHNELRSTGASWDYEDFKSHISLGKIRDIASFQRPIIFGDEYYMTWEEK